MGEWADEAIERLIHGPWKTTPRRQRHAPGPTTDKALAGARVAAHSAFDPIWRSGKMSRTKAYRWLAKALGVPDWQAHMARMDIATCHRVVELCNVRMFENLDAWKDELAAEYPELAHLI